MLQPRYTPFLHPQCTPVNIGCFIVKHSLVSGEQGRVSLRVQHKPHPIISVVAGGPIKTQRFPGHSGSLQILEAKNFHIGKESFRTTFGKRYGGVERWKVIGRLADPVEDIDTRMGHLVFHLYNCINFLDGELVDNYAFDLGRARRSIWNFGPWSLQIDSLVQINDSRKTAEEQGEFQLTHICYLSRNGKLFGSKEAFEVCEFLEVALGFIDGGYVGPQLAAGRRQKDPFVWIWPGPRLHSNKHRGSNWAFHHSYTGCMDLIPLLWEYWKVKRNREWIKRGIAICLEVRGKDLPTEFALSMAQTGIEMMACHILVEKDKVLSLGHYERLHTAGQFRTLLAHLNISLEIPDWARCRPRSHKGDLADALVDLRNSIIHPTSSNRDWLNRQDSLAQTDALTFMLEFLELSILYSIGYTGRYSTIFATGDFPSVPWVDPLVTAS